MNANKANYKIFNTRTGKYVSKSRGKATWSSKAWVLEAVSDHLRYNYKDAEHLEIHVFPVQSAIKVPYLEFLANEKEEMKAKAEARKQKEEARRKKSEANRLDYDIAEAERKLAELKARKQNL